MELTCIRECILGHIGSILHTTLSRVRFAWLAEKRYARPSVTTDAYLLGSPAAIATDRVLTFVTAFYASTENEKARERERRADAISYVVL